MKRKKLLICVTLVLAFASCLTLSGCFAIIGSILGNINNMISFVGGFNGEDNLPDYIVYGSGNPLTISFFNGKLAAYWDENSNENYEITVIKGNSSKTYKESNEDDAEYFDGAYFDLAGVGLTYSDDFSVNLKRINTSGNTYTTDTATFEGLSYDDYQTYTKNVPGGFVDIDYYIANRYELFQFFNYAIIFRPGAREVADKSGISWQFELYAKIAYDFYELYDLSIDKETAFAGEIQSAVSSFEDSAGYNYGYQLDENNVGGFSFKFFYDVTPTRITDTVQWYTNYSNVTNKPHYTLGESSERNFAIDDVDRTVTVSSSDQLYFALKLGYRPIPVRGSNAEKLYSRMRLILSEINTDENSDPTKIHNIYDYIVDTVVYDYRFVDVTLNDTSMDGNEFFKYKCLYLEGVFGMNNNGSFSDGNRVAICDGLSKAFLCLCTIEGIEARKISGTTEGGAHAWNKVRVNSVWYMVDTTWGNITPDQMGRELISHGYLMVSDDTDHIEDRWFTYPRANSGNYVFIGDNY